MLNDDCVTVLFRFLSIDTRERAAAVCKDWFKRSREYDPVISTGEYVSDADTAAPIVTASGVVFYTNAADCELTFRNGADGEPHPLREACYNMSSFEFAGIPRRQLRKILMIVHNYE